MSGGKCPGVHVRGEGGCPVTILMAWDFPAQKS